MSDRKIVFVDIREPEEYAAGHVKGAINIPPAELLKGVPPELAGLPKDTHLVLYCRSGSRSNVALHLLQEAGYTNVENGINRDEVEARYPGGR